MTVSLPPLMLLAFAASTVLSACSKDVETHAPEQAPEPAPEHAAEHSPELASELQLPPGFSAQVVFEGNGEARELIIREDGDLFVSLSGLQDGDLVLGLRDDDNDFVIDTVQSFFHVTTAPEQKVAQAHIDYFDNYLYATSNEQVVRLYLPLGQIEPDGEAETIVEHIPYQSSHRARTVSVDTAGWVYVTIGAPSNVCQETAKTTGSPGLDPCPQLERHAGIWRWRSDVTDQSLADGELYVGGVRNAVAQTWDPVYNGLYVGQMGRDRLDSLWPGLFDSEQNAELPAEEFFRAEKGQHYGWPYCYYDAFQGKKVLAPEYGGDGRKIDRCEDFDQPAVTFPAHYSPASIAFYHATQFPQHYRGGAFVALKGSWNRAPLPQDGYIVAYVPFEDGAPTGRWETFADGFKGFATLFERGNAVYRPQSVAVHPDGSLYILDNVKGRIWRVTYNDDLADDTATPAPQASNDRDLMVTTSQGRGAEVYTQFCSTCHQAQGGGVPGEFPPLANSAWVGGDKTRLIRSVLHGMQGPINIDGKQYDEVMPGHGFLGDKDLAALLTFVRNSFGNSADPVHESEILLVRSSDARTSPWNAQELQQQ